MNHHVSPHREDLTMYMDSSGFDKLVIDLHSTGLYIIYITLLLKKCMNSRLWTWYVSGVETTGAPSAELRYAT